MISDDNDLVEHRLAKLNFLRSKGLDPFSIERYDRTHLARQVAASSDELDGKEVSVAGRIVSLRPMGKATFAHLQDSSGRIQAYFKLDAVGEASYELLDAVHIGDFLGVCGTVGKTRTGEITVFANSFKILAKSLRPWPIGKQKGEQEWYGQ